MRTPILLIGLMVMLSTLGTSLASDEPDVDPSLVTVLSSGTYRFLLYRHCDAEYCWSEAYLQWVDVKARPSKVFKTVPIAEISKPMMVFDTRLHWDDDTHEQWIEMRGTAHPAMSFIGTMVIKPRDAGQYDFESNITKISN